MCSVSGGVLGLAGLLRLRKSPVSSVVFCLVVLYYLFLSSILHFAYLILKFVLDKHFFFLLGWEVIRDALKHFHISFSFQMRSQSWVSELYQFVKINSHSSENTKYLSCFEYQCCVLDIAYLLFFPS